MTSSNEVITLEGTGDNGEAEPMKFRTNFKPKTQMKYYPYFSDPAIVPRVKQYLEDNKKQVYIDIDRMVADLQKRYREYSKKKRSAFKASVEKAFQVVLQTYSVNDDTAKDVTDSSSEEMDIDSEDVDLIVDTNSTNNQVMNMYLQQTAMKKLASKSNAGNDEAKELIDISSDDNDEDEVPAKRIKHADATHGSESKIVSPSNSQQHKTNGQTLPSAATAAAAQEKAAVTNSTVADTNEPVKHTPAASVPAAPALKAAPVAVVTPPTVAALAVSTSIPVAPPSPSVSERPKRKRPAADSVAGLPSNSVIDDVPKKRRREIPVAQPNCSFKDVGGCSSVLQEVCKMLVHLRHPEIFEQIGVSPPRGFLLHGPPGCGKTHLASAIAGELGVPLLKVAAPELVAGVSGESEERIRDLFDQAVSIAPCVLFLDEIDAITPNRSNAQREMERRIVAQLLTVLDELPEKEGGNQVLVIGATNRPDSLDPALRRAGRFDREVCMGIPDRDARVHILRVVCGRLALASDVSSEAGIEELASLTPGFVGADLAALTREAAMVAVNRVFAQYQESKVNVDEAKSVSESQETVETTIERSGVVEEESKPAVEETPALATQEPMETSVEIETKSDGDTVADVESKQDSVENSTEQESIEEKKDDENCSEQTETVELEDADNEVQNANQVQETDNKDETLTLTPNSTEEAKTASQDDTGKTDSAEINNEVPSENNKTGGDGDVLEVDMVECPKETSEESGNKSDSVEGQQKVLELSQKLMPSSVWSPELCQLMAWLKDTPPLTPEQLSGLTITMQDFHEALRHVQPSAKREGFATVPDVTWDDIGSLANVRAELQLSVLAPVRYAKQFAELGLNAPAGVLLCGPPGCGKTLLAKAVANEAGINFISVKGPELLNMYVGESERAVRQVFQRARSSAPCVIFFDELDALCPKRSDSGDNGVSSRVVNQLLTEMDGVEGRSAVFLMAASNRPDIIDPAVLRPGRLDKVVYVGLPSSEDRKDILRALTKNGTRPQLAADVDLAELSRRSQLEGYSGADLAALVREAGVQALREFITAGDSQTGPLSVALAHFNSAADKIRPSVTEKDRKHYEKLQEKYSRTATQEKPETMDIA